MPVEDRVARTRVLPFLLVGLLALAAFAPSIHNGFVYDDEKYVLKNALISSWSWENLHAILTQPYFGNFHPMHLLIYSLERSAFGLSPAGWHIVSLTLHALNTVLLLRVLPRFGVPRGVALLGTLLFAVHPVQAETVVWVAEQKSLLSLFFTLISLDAYLDARVSGKIGPLLGSSIAFLAALASKVGAVGLVPALFAVEILRPPSLPSASGRPLVRLLPFVVLAGAWCNLGIFAHGKAGFIHPYPGGSLMATVLSIGPVLVAYGWNLLRPTGLSVAYDLAPSTELSLLHVLGAWLLVGATLTVLTRIAYRERERRLAIGLVWIGAALAPVLNLVPINTLMNDRYLYVPLCALGPMLAAGLFALGRRLAPGVEAQGLHRWTMGGMGVIVGALALGSTMRSEVFANDESLWVDAAAKSPRSSLARYNLGTLWLERGRDDLAEPELRAALEADPTRWHAYQNLGVIHFRQKRLRLARAEFHAATHLEPRSYDLWMNLADTQIRLGESAGSIASLRRASRLRPGAGAPYLALALVLEREGETARSQRAFQAFLSKRDGPTWQRRMAEEHLRTLKLQNRTRARAG